MLSKAGLQAWRETNSPRRASLCSLEVMVLAPALIRSTARSAPLRTSSGSRRDGVRQSLLQELFLELEQLNLARARPHNLGKAAEPLLLALSFVTGRYAVGIVGLLAELGSNLRILGHIRTHEKRI